MTRIRRAFIRADIQSEGQLGTLLFWLSWVGVTFLLYFNDIRILPFTQDLQGISLNTLTLAIGALFVCDLILHGVIYLLIGGIIFAIASVSFIISEILFDRYRPIKKSKIRFG